MWKGEITVNRPFTWITTCSRQLERCCLVVFAAFHCTLSSDQLILILAQLVISHLTPVKNSYIPLYHLQDTFSLTRRDLRSQVYLRTQNVDGVLKGVNGGSVKMCDTFTTQRTMRRFHTIPKQAAGEFVEVTG